MGGQDRGGDDSRGLRATIEQIKSKNKDELSKYDKELLRWYRNVDKRYAWVVLLSLGVFAATIHGSHRIYGLLYAKLTKDGVYTRAEASWPLSMVVTLEMICGPVASILAYRSGYRRSFIIGSLLVALGNGLTALSGSLVIDIILYGVVQGVGCAFVTIPFIGIINDYFLKYRTFALGLIFSGSTLSSFILLPIFEWLLDHYPWRYFYYGLGLLTATNILVAPLLMSNPRPNPSRPMAKSAPLPPQINKGQASVISRQVANKLEAHATQDSGGDDNIGFSSTVRSILKTPVIYIICYQQLCQFWLHSVYSMVLVDYGTDRGFSPQQADRLINIQSIGDILGRLGLTILVDVQVFLSSTRIVTTLVFYLLAASLCLLPMVATTYVCMAGLTVVIEALITLLFILINGLLVDYFGDRKVTLCYGMISFISGLMLASRPFAVGYFRDTLGSYDLMMASMGFMCALGGSAWALEPTISRWCAVPPPQERRQSSSAV